MRLTSGTLIGALAIAGAPAAAQELSTESFAVNARVHAHAVTTSFQRLRDFIVRRSTGATSWAGDVPPATTGWNDAWTDRGVRARYCADPGEKGVLVVYMGPGRLMGVGEDHRAVQAAPRVYGRQRQRLHWLEGGRALGGDGRPTVDLPVCMAALVPSGRAAVAAEVEDPWTVTQARTAWERRELAMCPPGMHRPPGLAASDAARIERRTVTTQVNKNGDPVGTAVFGPWSISVDLCASDYTVTETEQRPCTYTVEGQTVNGYEIWTRQKRITALGEAGTWSMMFTTCQVGPIASAPTPPGTPTPLPQPTISFPTWTETEGQSCPYCFQGTASRSRIHTDRHVQFPWDSTPTIQTDVQITQWVTDNSQCSRIADTVWTQVRTEQRTLNCGSGFSGTYTQQRSVTDRYVQPCGGSVGVTRGVSSTAWVTVRNGCVAIPPPLRLRRRLRPLRRRRTILTILC